MSEIGGVSHSPQARATALYAQALPRHYLGDLLGAREHFLQAIKHHRKEDFVGLPLASPIFGALIMGGANEWQLGYPEKALYYVNKALRLARDEATPTLGAFALITCCYVHQLRRDHERTLEACTEGARLAAVIELPLLSALAVFYEAWSDAQRRGTNGAADKMRGALTQFDTMNFHLARGGFLGSLCEVQALSGAVENALVTVDQALRTNPNELIFRPDLLRMRAELRIQNASQDKDYRKLAELDSYEAIELARRIGAKSLELRVSTSLARLLLNRPPRRGARDPRRNLQLVHRWLRYRRPERGEGAARRIEPLSVSTRGA